MKNVLVVSDNEPLVHHLKEVVRTEEVRSIAQFDFRYSSVNKKPETLIKLGLSPVNLKDQTICNEIIATYQLVFSLHCKQIFPARLVNNTTCINFHPGYNPHNRGWYPQVFSIINKKPIGATIHVMDEQIDHGAIIAQQQVNICSNDTSCDVYNRVIELEKKLISENLVKIISDRYQAFESSNDGNYNSIEDFRVLCELKLDQIGTLGEHLDLLRALTHGSFNNAFFFENGKKIFVKISLVESGWVKNNVKKI